MIRCRVASSSTSSLQLIPARNSAEPPPPPTSLPFAPLKAAAAPKHKGSRVDARYRGVVSTSLQAKTRRVSCASVHRQAHVDPQLQVAPLSPSPATAAAAVAEDFYSSLNNKSFKKLYEIFADGCVFEDLSFAKPFQGEEVHQFLKSLTEAMGADVKFIIDSTFEGRESSIAVRWHLEWQQKRIPFATGCTFFYCSPSMGKLRIERACVLVESPVKPGGIVLEVLKIISSMFDRHPEQAKWFLERPLVLIQFVTKAYTMLIMPFLLPVWKYNTRIATYGTRILQTLFGILK